MNEISAGRKRESEPKEMQTEIETHALSGTIRTQFKQPADMSKVALLV